MSSRNPLERTAESQQAVKMPVKCSAHVKIKSFHLTKSMAEPFCEALLLMLARFISLRADHKIYNSQSRKIWTLGSALAIRNCFARWCISQTSDGSASSSCQNPKHQWGNSSFCERGPRTIVQPSFHCLRSLENSHTRVS